VVLHYDGIFIDLLQQTIKDTNSRLSSKALQVFRTIITTETVEEVLERDGFLLTLQHILQSQQDTNRRIEVANTILHIASYIKPNMNITYYFIQMLVGLSQVHEVGDTISHTICIETSSRAILKMTLVANNHGILIQTPGLLTSLSSIASSSHSNLRENATGALFNLSCSTSIHSKEYMLSNTILLYTLVQIICSSNTLENRYSRDFAVGTLVNLCCVCSDDVRTRLVRFDGLVSSLISFVSDGSVDWSVKESVKSSIIQLVSVI